MQQTTIYKILTFILLPFAALFGLSALVFLFIGLANPVILLPVFIMAGFTIYAVCSTIFLVKGIMGRHYCKPSLKDWLKVNGYVSTFMGVMCLTNSFTIISTPKTKLKDLATELMASQPVKPEGLSTEMIISIMVGLSYVLLVFAIILLIHLSLNFRLLKKYGYVFGNIPTE